MQSTKSKHVEKPVDTTANDALRVGAGGSIKVGSRVFVLNPPTESETLTIVMEARKHIPTPLGLLVNDPAFKLLPESVQAKAVETAAREQIQPRSGLTERDLGEALLHPASMAFAVWLCARKNHDGLTLEEVRGLVTDANIGQVFVDYAEATGLIHLEKPEKNSGGGAGS